MSTSKPAIPMKKLAIVALAVAGVAACSALLVKTDSHAATNATAIPATKPSALVVVAAAPPQSSDPAAAHMQPAKAPTTAKGEMTEEQRREYIQHQLDDIGDGHNTATAILNLGDLGPAASAATETLIRHAEQDEDDSKFLVYMTLARIGEPRQRVGEFLARRAVNTGNPLVYAALAIMGDKASDQAVIIEQAFASTYAKYQSGESVPDSALAVDDGESEKPNSVASFDSAIALLAINPQSKHAADAAARLMRGDPRLNILYGHTVYAEILFTGTRATDKPDFWYGVALAKALANVGKNPALRDSMANLLVNNAVNDRRFSDWYSDEAIKSRVAAADRADRERYEREQREWEAASRQRDQYGFPTKYATPPMPVETRTFSHQMEATHEQNQTQMKIIRSHAMSEFACWAMRAMTADKWGEEEREWDKQIIRLGDNKPRNQGPTVDQVAEMALKSICPADVKPAPENTAESLGLLRTESPEAVSFLSSLLTEKGSAIVHGRAALALGRIGPAGKTAAGALKTMSERDASPTVRRIATWAYQQVTK